MKKVLITGANSYIGRSFNRWVTQYPDKYSVEAISLQDTTWKEKSFTGYDVIMHTAAIVHVKEIDKAKYFRINRDLALDVAKKAKEEGVKQFIFLSTMGVYGRETGFITRDTIATPKTPYTQSKYEAEQLLQELNSDSYSVTIIRPPLVYGNRCPGNYARLAKMALKLRIFPDIENERSMIYIDNLSEFIRLIIEHNVGGVYFPQNLDYVNTTKLVKMIARTHGEEIKITKVFNRTITIGFKYSVTLRKVFGSFVYDKGLLGGPGTLINGQKLNYETTSFETSIALTEKDIGD